MLDQAIGTSMKSFNMYKNLEGNCFTGHIADAKWTLKLRKCKFYDSEIKKHVNRIIGLGNPV